MGYLINDKKKSQTIKSYISAIRAILMEIGLELNENKYLIASLTKACRVVNDHFRTWLPIQKPMLNMLLKYTDRWFISINQPYLARLYRAVFSTAYFGLLRISEITQGSHSLKVGDVQIATNKNKILLVLRSSKTHDISCKPQKVKITSMPLPQDSTTSEKMERKRTCPFKILKDYIEVRHCRH